MRFPNSRNEKEKDYYTVSSSHRFFASVEKKYFNRCVQSFPSEGSVDRNILDSDSHRKKKKSSLRIPFAIFFPIAICPGPCFSLR